MCLYYDGTIFGSPSRSSSSALDFFVFGLIHYIAPPHFTFYMPTGIVQMKNGTKEEGKRKEKRGKGEKRKKEKRGKGYQNHLFLTNVLPSSCSKN